MAVVIYKMTVVNIETALLVRAANEVASADLLTMELQSKGYDSASASTLPQIMDSSPTSAPSVTPARAPSSGSPTVIAVTQVTDILIMTFENYGCDDDFQLILFGVHEFCSCWSI
jgi:hypothetical protein